MRWLVALMTLAVCCGPAAANERWRASGHLVTRAGRAYDFTLDVFRYPSAHGVTLEPAAATIVDERALATYSERRTERAARGLARARAIPLDLVVGDWRLAERQPSGPAQFTLALRAGEAALQLTGAARKRRVVYQLDGDDHDGYSSIAATGSVHVGDRSESVSGTIWLDHTAGDTAALEPGTRFAEVDVQLDDGREIVAEYGSAGESAVLVRRDGSVETLSGTGYAFNGANVRHSTRAAADYPSQWGLWVVDQTEQLLIEPVVLDQESPAHGDGDWFYDGAFDVFDNTPGSTGARLGSASALLVGFDRPSAAR